MRISAAEAKLISLDNRKRLPEHLEPKRDEIMKSIFTDITCQAMQNMFMTTITLQRDMKELGVEDGMLMLMEIGSILASLGYKTSDFHYYRPEITIYWE